MRAIIDDATALAALTPDAITAYLRSRRWTQVSTEPERISRFTLATDEGEIEAEVPLRPELLDYPRRVAEVLRTLSLVEARSQLALWQDIQQATVDTIRIVVDGEQARAGRIGLGAGTSLFAQTREVMLAGACAAIEKRPVFAKRKPDRAMRYLDAISLAAPAPGSFVVSVESPVTPWLGLAGQEEELPFERLVTATLAQASLAVLRAATTAMGSGSVQPFVDAVPLGLTANLCDALAGIVSDTAARHVTLSFAWSTNRPLPAAPASVRFDAAIAPTLRSAAKYFREHTPRADFELTGVPVQLESEDPGRGGAVIVQALVDERPRRVRVLLDAPEYVEAIRAHQQGLAVSLEGEMKKEGRALMLRNPRELRVHEESAE